MANGLAILSQRRRGCGITFLLLMLLHSTTLATQETYSSSNSEQSQEDESSLTDATINATSSHDRGEWYHVRLDNQETHDELVLNEAIQSSSKSQHLMSATMLMKLIPYEDAMDEYQTTVYENGLQNFLIDYFGSSKQGSVLETFEIKEVSVLNSRIALPSKDRNNPNKDRTHEEDHVLYVTTSIVAEPKADPSPLTSEAFGALVVTYCNEFSSELIRSWQTEEDTTIDRTDDWFEDNVTFKHVLEFEVQAIVGLGNGDDIRKESGEKSPIGIVLALGFFGLCICSPFFYLWWARRKRMSTLTVEYDCVQDKTSNGDINSIPAKTLKPPGKHKLFPRRKKKYGIIESVITFDQSTDFISKDSRRKSSKSKKSKKHKYARMDSSRCGSNDSSSTDMDTMSGITSLGSSGSGDDESLSSIKTTMVKGRQCIQMECVAPAGKLGVSIDTVDGQPVIHRVKESSPLHGLLGRLDIIVRVDEIDTSSMSAADVTLIMARRMSKERKITFLRGVKKQLEFV